MSMNDSNSTRVDLINIGLILLSAILAFLLPFTLFLFAYAIVGPLHYLTEINWLKDRSFFVTNNPMWLGLVIAATLVMTMPKLIIFLGGSSIDSENLIVEILNVCSNPILLLCIWSAGVLTIVHDSKKQFIGLGLGVVVFALSFLVPSYLLLLGLLIPTIIHVYVFTILFMLYGAQKSNSQLGYASVVMMLCVPILLFTINVDGSFYNIPSLVKTGFIDSGFHLTNIKLGKLLGVADGTSFFFYGSWELKLQRFIAFAYTYHYLNWFSKTAIIGWHKSLTGKTFWTIMALWLAMVSLFLIDYRIGFFGALGLSFLHVLLELPLNAISVKSILK